MHTTFENRLYAHNSILLYTGLGRYGFEFVVLLLD